MARFVRDVSAFSQKCVFSETKDVQKVVSGLATDINDMLETGIVRDAETSQDNNGIDDPSHILGVVRDPFDALEAERALSSIAKSRKEAKEKEKAAAAAAAAAVDKPSSSSE